MVKPRVLCHPLPPAQPVVFIVDSGAPGDSLSHLSWSPLALDLISTLLALLRASPLLRGPAHPALSAPRPGHSQGQRRARQGNEVRGDEAGDTPGRRPVIPLTSALRGEDGGSRSVSLRLAKPSKCTWTFLSQLANVQLASGLTLEVLSSSQESLCPFPRAG